MEGRHLVRHGVNELTDRQREVLRLIAEGRTNAEIAERLDISLDGAKYHVREILGKLGVESREEAVAAWRAGRTPVGRVRSLSPRMSWLGGWRLLAGAGMVATAAVVAVVALTVLRHDDRAASAPQPTPTLAPSPTILPTPTTAPAVDLPPCTSATAKLKLEVVPQGDDILLRLSANGTEPCRLQGPALLRTLYPPTDPSPPMPPQANTTRTFKVSIDFPFNGELAEWTWSNWCTPPVTNTFWMLTIGSPVVASTNGFASQVPACVSQGSPTTLRVSRLATGVDGESSPSHQCARSMAGWLCEFASALVGELARTPAESVIRPRLSHQTYYTCDGKGNAIGIGAADACTGTPANDQVPGWWLSDGAGRVVLAGEARFEGAMGGQNTHPGAYLAAVGAPDQPKTFERFLVVIATRSTPAYIYLAFQLEGGHEPGIIGGGVTDDATSPLVAGGTIETVLGETTVIAFPPPP